MKILHILNDGQTELSTKVTNVQSKDNEIKIIDLTKEKSYEGIINDIFMYDKVVSW